MSLETDRYYAEGFESGAMDLHKWMRRAERAEAECLALTAELEECQEWRCHDKDINNDQVERIRELEDAAASWEHKYANARQYNRNLEGRCQRLEAALRKFGVHNRELGDCWPKCECGLEAALGSALETSVVGRHMTPDERDRMNRAADRSMVTVETSVCSCNFDKFFQATEGCPVHSQANLCGYCLEPNVPPHDIYKCSVANRGGVE